MLLSRRDFLLFWQKNDSEAPFLTLRSLRGRSKRCAPQVLKSCYKSLQSKHAEAFCFIHERHGLTRKLKDTKFRLRRWRIPKPTLISCFAGAGPVPVRKQNGTNLLHPFFFMFSCRLFHAEPRRVLSHRGIWDTELSRGAYGLWESNRLYCMKRVACYASSVKPKFRVLKIWRPWNFVSIRVFRGQKRFADMALYGWQGVVGRLGVVRSPLLRQPLPSSKRREPLFSATQ